MTAYHVTRRHSPLVPAGRGLARLVNGIVWLGLLGFAVLVLLPFWI